MSQVTKFVPKVNNTHDSVIEILKDISAVCQDPEVTNIFAVIIKANGNYIMTQSANIGRHRTLGILAEMHHNLLVADD